MDTIGLYRLLKSLIVKNGISIPNDELKFQLQSHPSYPSLHAVTGVLSHFKIPNIAVRLVPTTETVEKLPQHFLAVVKNEDVEQLAGIQKNGKWLKMRFENGKTQKIAVAQFATLWNGIIVAIEKDETIPNLPKNTTSKWSIAAITTLGLALIGALLYATSHIFNGLHFLSSLVGLLISILITRQALGYSSSVAQNICNLSEKTSCDAVLNSKSAKIFKGINLSDISLISFGALVLFWIALFLLDATPSNLIFIITALSIPVIAYSIYTQAVTLKKWCPLCLGIVGILLFQNTMLFTIDGFSLFTAISASAVLAMGLSFLMSAASWSLLKPFLQKKIALDKIELEHQKFKRNFKVFNTLLNTGNTITETSFNNELIFGNKNALVALTVVTSPFCFYCKSAHADIHQLLKTAKDDIKITLRFRTSPEDKSDPLYKIVSELLDIYHTKGEKACLHLLDELYADNAKLQQWSKRTNINYKPSYDVVIQQQKDWCTLNNINFTPAVYLSGKEFPSAYQRPDLGFFLEDLANIQQEDNNLLPFSKNKAS